VAFAWWAGNEKVNSLQLRQLRQRGVQELRWIAKLDFLALPEYVEIDKRRRARRDRQPGGQVRPVCRDGKWIGIDGGEEFDGMP
jgi:hypothetical protein